MKKDDLTLYEAAIHELFSMIRRNIRCKAGAFDDFMKRKTLAARHLKSWHKHLRRLLEFSKLGIEKRHGGFACELLSCIKLECGEKV